MNLHERIKRNGRVLVDSNWGPVFLTDLGRDDGQVLITEGRVNYFTQENTTIVNEGIKMTLPTPEEISAASSAPKGLTVISGKVQNAGGMNQNGRVYDRKILESQVEAYQEKIDQRLALGECDHPADRGVVEWNHCSHLITKLWWKGDDLWANIALLPSPFKGELLETAFNLGIPIGFSSRGKGTVREVSGRAVVGDDFTLICWDAVTDPSVPGAFARNRVTEGREIYTQPRSEMDRLLDSIIGGRK